MYRRLLCITMALMTVLICCTFVSCSKTETEASWAYPFVVWNGKTYAVSSEKVSTVENKIGSVKYYSDEETSPVKNGFSNYFKVGTNLYSVKNISTDDSIAAETSKGRYEKLTRKK